MYEARTKHLVKLIWQQEEIKIEKCPVCENEKWVDYDCPNIQCCALRNYTKVINGLKKEYPGFAKLNEDQ